MAALVGSQVAHKASYPTQLEGRNPDKPELCCGMPLLGLLSWDPTDGGAQRWGCWAQIHLILAYGRMGVSITV